MVWINILKKKLACYILRCINFDLRGLVCFFMTIQGRFILEYVKLLNELKEDKLEKGVFRDQWVQQHITSAGL